jgi:hypothetical protein
MMSQSFHKRQRLETVKQPICETLSHGFESS